VGQRFPPRFRQLAFFSLVGALVGAMVGTLVGAMVDVPVVNLHKQLIQQ
jgi:uncharacterized membrane protein